MENAVRPCRSLIPLLLLLLTGCAAVVEQWKPPQVVLAGISPQAIGLDRQSFVVRLRVKNPNDRPLPIEALTYRLAIEGTEIARGDTALGQEIPAFGKAMVDLKVNSNLLAVLPAISMAAATQERLHWTIAGTVSIAGGLVALPYWYSGAVDTRSLIEQAGAFGPMRR
jgi:LEA14-like dessication related protein